MNPTIVSKSLQKTTCKNTCISTSNSNSDSDSDGKRKLLLSPGTTGLARGFAVSFPGQGRFSGQGSPKGGLGPEGYGVIGFRVWGLGFRV